MQIWKRKDKHMRKNGFTLIELLIVVAIIGILSTLLMANFIGVRQRARDAQRKTDLRQIQAALEIYRSDMGNYPPNDVNYTYQLNKTTCPTNGSLISPQDNTTVYMQSIPCDPLGSSQSYNNDSYYYVAGNGNTTYTLSTCLENTSDSQGTTTTPDPNAPNNAACTAWYVLKNP
jgi:type II secretion system protein G